MRLTTEDGSELLDPTPSQVTQALSKLGLPGNGFAIIERSEQHYIQTSGSRADGYVVEYRDGGEGSHFSSVREDLSHREMVELLLAYLKGGGWVSLTEWQNQYSRGCAQNAGRNHLDSRVKWMLITFFAIGVASMVIGSYVAIKTRHFLAEAVEVPGVVTEIVRRADGYSPVVEYTDQSGRTRVLHTTWSTTPSIFHRGEQVGVLYEASDIALDQHARINTFAELWGGVTFAMVFGVGFSGIASAAWLVLRKRKHGASNKRYASKEPIRGH